MIETMIRTISYLKALEPRLTDEEKAQMLEAILSKDSMRRRWRRAVLAACACLTLLIGMAAAWHFSTPASPGLISLLRASTVGGTRTSLLIGDVQMSLDNRAHVYCRADRQEVIIAQRGGSVSLHCNEAGSKLVLAVPGHQMATVTLSDGSQVSLRGGTRLAFPLDIRGKERNVAMAGEAYLRVRHDEASPFQVQTPAIGVRVLGTEFLVSARDEAPAQEVTLVRGSVEVTTPAGHAVRVRPGETLRYNRTDRSCRVMREERLSDKTAWASGLLMLYDRTLDDVLRQIEQIYGQQLDFSAPGLRDIRLQGKLDVSVPLPDVLRNLEHIAPVTVRKANGKYTITPKS